MSSPAPAPYVDLCPIPEHVQPQAYRCGPLCLVLFGAFVVYTVHIIQSRSFYIILIQALANIGAVASVMIKQVTYLPCPNLIWFAATHLTLGVSVYCLAVRAVFLYIRVTLNRLLLENFAKRSKMWFSTSRSQELYMQGNSGEAILGPQVPPADQHLGWSCFSSCTPAALTSSEKQNHFTEATMLKSIAVFFIVLAIPVFVIGVLYGDLSCPKGFGNDWNILKIILGLFFVLGMAVVIGLRDLHDGHRIRIDLQIVCIVGIPLNILYLAWFGFSIEDRVPNVLVHWNPSMFVTIGGFVTHTTTVVVPLWQIARFKLREWRNDVPKGMDENSFWRVVLENGSLWKSFKDFAARDFCVRHILPESTVGSLLGDDLKQSTGSKSSRKTPAVRTFWATQLPDGVAREVPKELQSRWTKMAAMYIGEGAQFELNLPSHLVEEIQRKIKSETINLDLYDGIFAEIFT
ncbi:hypothetical protein M427DRAFT_32246 [Gonapodya prolifera JEL478]|uniref:RGS domain-containing protein n=1 Tax=Gonapodya prolifera (strain JEL478) TaxID=1344416 RepID=A0A139AGL4_GONPJ|nr:hypothetical protein M427DRAFT_32246 [Gonapodya prolifera JEL478]|eukprot:KXS15553.1 hypothetical protein M427DRAFT_32246 [Gonapodya prolifera JEL478]